MGRPKKVVDLAEVSQVTPVTRKKVGRPRKARGEVASDNAGSSNEEKNMENSKEENVEHEIPQKRARKSNAYKDFVTGDDDNEEYTQKNAMKIAKVSPKEAPKSGKGRCGKALSTTSVLGIKNIFYYFLLYNVYCMYVVQL